MKSSQVIDKPWGREELLEVNSVYVLKRLTMNAGHRCSLQYHKHKTETVFIISGELEISEGDDISSLTTQTYLPGTSVTIHPGRIHRMTAITDSVYLEASTPELDDVIRIQDDYIR